MNNDDKQVIDPEILEQAADWLVLLHSGTMTESQQTQFQQWQAAHHDHQKAIDRMNHFNKGFQQLPKQFQPKKLLKSRQRFHLHLSQKLLLVFSPFIAFWCAYQYLPWQLWQADASSNTGEIKTISLQDGSKLTLASDSHVNIQFNEHVRKIELLQGEIYIHTAKQVATHYRPFIVTTDNGSIQALGTRFSVRQNHSDQDTTVNIYQHAVAIQPIQSNVPKKTITQGQSIQFNQHHYGHTQKLQQAQPYWMQHLLVVDNKRLDQVLTEIYRYQTGTYFMDSQIKNIRVSGVFSLKNPKQSIETLAKTYHLQLDYYSQYILHVKKSN
ncbi:DUF4880 domain-containing protein [Acinetobacter qingfengensis]|uniref:Uncharacterized protein n=1 Tax=Acinetobacter qingfengensis TaxID=1262585 RepID=A0A1E7RER4_9GAMM|nr:FecR domain-containing protein [Acinetobacter qingfengensis]KAA8735664.1 DUF4880 domain-containing protein [Acinetobacter qingfengensis]OEY97890.1 hypothetical protein BJI46_07420 [Acinetobacter qingfengensis]